MFSKRHYDFLARFFRDSRDDAGADIDMIADIAAMATDLSTRLERDNSRFDRERFLKACGL
jgi:hypothetical protein